MDASSSPQIVPYPWIDFPPHNRLLYSWITAVTAASGASPSLHAPRLPPARTIPTHLDPATTRPHSCSASPCPPTLCPPPYPSCSWRGWQGLAAGFWCTGSEVVSRDPRSRQRRGTPQQCLYHSWADQDGKAAIWEWRDQWGAEGVIGMAREHSGDLEVHSGGQVGEERGQEPGSSPPTHPLPFPSSNPISLCSPNPLHPFFLPLRSPHPSYLLPGCPQLSILGTARHLGAVHPGRLEDCRVVVLSRVNT